MTFRKARIQPFDQVRTVDNFVPLRGNIEFGG